MLHTLPAAVRDAFKLGVTTGLHGVVVGGAVMAALVFVFAWFIREVPLRGKSSSAVSRVSGGAPPGEKLSA